VAAAGAGGGAATASPGLALGSRVIATVVAGGALAAAGQTALTQALPFATDGANVLKLSVQELVGTAPAQAVAGSGTAVAPLVDLAPSVEAVPAEPRVAEVGELVKAMYLHSRAAEAAAQAVEAAQPAPAAPSPVTVNSEKASEQTPAHAETAVVASGAVQMVTGRVTSGFGARWGTRHRGLDIAAPIGTPIHAPLAGEVVDSGPASGFGLWVRLRHDDGTVTTYGHVNRSLVRVGDQVAAGEEIAEVGNRGRSTGPHLHMEVQSPGGTTINPRPWLDDRGIEY
jgi:murein DD-endopeptidase MepM/ murein hydrolase activator NlpD